MIAVIMVLMLVSVVTATSIHIAEHTNDVTSVDRERLQSIQAADAGVSDAIGRIEMGAGCDPAPTAFTDLTDGAKVISRYRTRVDPEAATTCGETSRRVIHSWGYSTTGGTRALRHLEVTVELVPQAGFPFTLFAEGSTGTIYVKNSGTINGDAYAETLDQSKNNLAAASIVTPGSIITKNNAVYSGTLWAGGDITLGQNSNIGRSLIASGTAPGSQGSITIGDNSVVAGDAKAKGAVTLGSGAIVHGSISQNNPNVLTPPALVKPAFAWDPSNYSPAPVQKTAAQITSDLNAARNNLQGVYRSTDTGGTITFPDDATITGNLTIVSSGKVKLGRTLSIAGGPWTVVVVAQSNADDAIDIPKSLTAASGLHLLLWAAGGVDMKNAAAFTGSIYANKIDAKNTFTIQQSEVLAHTAPPGFTFSFATASQFAAVPTLWREIVPGLPPP
jgi:hypothetical protein